MKNKNDKPNMRLLTNKGALAILLANLADEYLGMNPHDVEKLISEPRMVGDLDFCFKVRSPDGDGEIGICMKVLPPPYEPDFEYEADFFSEEETKRLKKRISISIDRYAYEKYRDLIIRANAYTEERDGDTLVKELVDTWYGLLINLKGSTGSDKTSVYLLDVIFSTELELAGKVDILEGYFKIDVGDLLDE